MQLDAMTKFTALTLILGTCAFAGVGCSSESSGSTSKKDAGSDAGADAGGDAAVDAAKACSDTTDCDDGDPCNGLETCDTAAGTCKPGTSPCAPASDPAHCEVICTNQGGQAACGKETARDGDGDGHGDSQCAAAPGDDCDDTNKDVHPGATEVCDGIDGDCDGASDIDDGFPLGGTPFNVAAPPGADAVRPQAAWAPGANKLGVVWTDFRGSAFQVFFSLYSETGAPIVSDVVVSSTQFEAQHGVVASDGKSFGVAFVGEITGARHVFFRQFDLNGKPTTSTVQVSANAVEPDASPGITLDSVGYLVTWKRRVTVIGKPIDLVQARKIDASGSTPGNEIQIQAASAPRVWGYHVVRNGPEYMHLTAHSADGLTSATDLALVRTDSQFVQTYKGTPGTSAGGYGFPLLSSLDKGVMAAFALSAGFGFSQLRTDGSVDCGPVLSNKLTAPVELGGLGALNDTALAVAHVSMGVNQAEIRLLRFDSKCQEFATIDVAGAKVTPADSGPTFGSRTDVAVGDNKIAVVWDEKPGANAVVKARIFGKNFCD